MFVESLLTIFEKLSKSKNKEKGLELLENKINNNPTLFKANFLFNTIKESKNKFYSYQEVNALLETSNIDSSKLELETKKLLEFYKINTNSLKRDNYIDKIILEKDSEAIKKYFFNKDLLLKEEYKNALKEKDERFIEEKLNYLGSINLENKLITESITTVNKDKVLMDFKPLVEKTFKLDKVVNKNLNEAITFKLSKIGNSLANEINYYPKELKLDVKFILPFYPVGKGTAEWMRYCKGLKAKLDSLKTTFIRKCLSDTGIGAFINPADTYWTVKFRSQVHGTQEMIENFETPITFRIIFSLNQKIEKELVVKYGKEVTNIFLNNIKDWIDNYSDSLDKNIQKENLKTIKNYIKSKTEKPVSSKEDEFSIKKGKEKYFDIDAYGKKVAGDSWNY